MEDQKLTREELLEALAKCQAQVRVLQKALLEGTTQAGESRYKAIVEGQTELVSRWLPDTTVTFVNQAYCDYFGHPVEEVLGTKFLPNLPDEAQRVVQESVKKLTSGETDHLITEELSYDAQGQPHWIQWTYGVVRDEKGKLTELQSVGRDVSTLHETYQALERANLLVEQSPVVFFQRKVVDNILDKILYVSDNVKRYGYTAEDFTTGRVPFEQTIHPDDLQRVGKILLGNLANKVDEYEFEYRSVLPGDRLVWFALQAQIKRDEQGQAVLQQGTFIDITESKQAEELLAEALDIATLAYWEFDVAKGSFLFNDDYYQRILHTTVEKAGGYWMPAQTFAMEYVNPEDAASVPAKIQEALQSPDLNYQGFAEARLRGGDGQERNILMRMRIIKDAEGNTIKLYGTNQDVTESKQAEELLARRAQELATVAEVGTAVATVLDPEEMLQNVVDLTKERFGLYHAHVYLLDESGETLVLRSGAGEVGRQMVAEKRSIPLEAEQSLVARAARTKLGVTVNDVRSDPDFLPHPLLPETRSELAVPLAVGSQVLGVLDVQSEQVGRFTEEDIRIQTTLASQVAVALQNARQFEEISRLGKIVETSQDGMVITSMEGIVEFANQAMAKMHGYDDAKELIGKPLMIFQTEQQLQEVMPLMAQMMESPEGVVAEVGHVHRDGTEFPTRMVGQVLRDDDGIPYAVVTGIQDITARKQAEFELTQSEERFRSLVSNITGVVYRCALDQDYTMEFMTRQIEEISGYPAEDFIGNKVRTFASIIHPEDVTLVDEAINKTVETREPYFIEYRIKTADGSERWVSEGGRVVFTEGDQVGWLDGAIFDITERKQAEARLAEALDIATLAYWELDIDKGSFLFNDDIYERILHITVEEAGGYWMPAQKFASTYLHPDDAPAVATLTQAAIETDDPNYENSAEVRYLCGDGKVRNIFMRFRIVKDDQGRTIRTYGTNQDITDRKQAEELLERRAQELATVAEVGTAVATVLEPEEMLQSVVELTKERFGLYHAHVYLLDESGETLVLRSGAGEVGRQMVAEKRSIPLEAEQSLVARAARTKLGVTVNDVRSDPDFLPHPLLPETRSELAVPLVVGDQVLGVLDVQSEQVGRFTEEDIRIQTTLASQVAVALQNARQYEQVTGSEKLIRSIIDATPDWIFVKDLEHRYVMVNEGYGKSLHIPVEEFIGKNDIDLGFPEELVKGNPEKGIRGFWADDRQVFETDAPIFFENDIVQIDGQRRIYSTLKTPLHDADGKVSGVLAFARDVTEREEASQALEDAITVVEQSPVIVFRRKVVNNMLDEILYVSDNVKRYGYTAEEFTTGRVPFEQTVHPDDLQFVGETLIGNLQNNVDEYQFEYRGVFPGDVMTWFTLQAAIERDANGEAILQVGTIIDITEIKEAQLAVAENEARFRTLVDAVPDMIFRFDATGKFVDYKGAEGGTYVPPEVFLGKHYSEVLPPNVAALTKEALEKGGAEEKTQTFEYQLPNEAGDQDTFEARIITNETGEAVGLIRDVTEQRSATVLIGKRAQELATVAEVGTAVSTVLDPEEMLQSVVELTKERFGLYHAHVYLLDESGETLVLRSGAGEVGRQMVAEKRSIPLEAEQSLVARAARTKLGVTVNDVRSDPDFLPHPLLPETRSELAVPLVVGGQVLGVLDVQSEQVGRFTEEDIRIQTTLASQVAVALQNARQYEQSRQSEALVRSIIDGIPDWIFLKDKQFRFMMVNKSFADAMHLSFEEMLGKTDMEVGFPEELVMGDPEKGIEGFRVDDQRVIETGETQIITDDVVQVDGQQKILYTTKSPLRDASGEVIGMLGIGRDVSELRQASEQLKEALEIASLAYWEFDVATGSFLFNNDYYQRILHTTAEKAGGYWMPAQTFAMEYVNPEDAASVPVKIQEALQAEDPNYEGFTEARLRGGDGQERNVMMRMRIVKDAEGNTIKLYGTNQDITDRKQAEFELTQSEERFRSLVSNITGAVYRCALDADYTMYFISEPIETISGYPAEDFIENKERAYASIIHPDDLTLVDQAINKTVETREPYFIEYRIRTADGSERWVSEGGRVVFTEGDQVGWLDGAIFDITERKQAEARLAEALDIATLAYWELDLATFTFTFSDDFYERILHTTTEEAGGNLMPAEKFAAIYLHPDDAEAVPVYTQAAIETDDPNFEAFVEVRYLCGDGKQRDILMRMRVVKDDQGKTIKTYGTNQDITDRKQAEELLERRAQELATVAEVGTAVATVLEPEEMLQNVVDLTKERFELYHAHVYLLDESGETLVLRSGAGEVGRQMVAEKRSIPLEAEQSLVARAARTKLGVTVNDVRSDPDFLPHPLLPETRSELAVPLVVGGQVLGVLDVQSEQVGRFTEEDIRIQTTLASQVAVALQNARQFEQVRQSEELVRTMIDSTSDWIFVKDLDHRYVLVNKGYADSLHISPEEFIGKNDIDLGFPEELVKGNPEKGIRGFWADDRQVFETNQPLTIENDVVMIDGKERNYSTVKTPLRDVNNKVIGVLAFGRDFTEREELLKETRSQAEQEALINAISQKIQATTTVENALQVAIRELGQSLGAKQTSVRLGVDKRKN